MKRIKVVQFIHGFSTGGAENLVKQYCQLFNKEKVDLLVVALHNYHSIFDCELDENGIRVTYIDDMIDHKFRCFPVAVQKAMHRLFRKVYVRQVLRNFAPNVIHYHLLLSDYVKYAKLNYNTKLFLTVHNEPKVLWSDKRLRKKDKRETEWLTRHFHFRFIVLHEKMRKEINEMFGVENTIIVNNGVIIDRFRITIPKEQIKAELGIPMETAVIGHIGRFTDVKNHEFLVEVFEQYLKLNSSAVLILIGTGGALQDTIRESVKKKGLEQRVFFLGTRGDIPEMLHIMDAMVFPSRYEGLPVTLIEAQVSGVPCLVSDCVAKDVEISNILFFESLEHSADDWAKALDRIICDSTLPVINLKEWDLKYIVKGLEDLYTS